MIQAYMLGGVMLAALLLAKKHSEAPSLTPHMPSMTFTLFEVFVLLTALAMLGIGLFYRPKPRTFS